MKEMVLVLPAEDAFEITEEEHTLGVLSCAFFVSREVAEVEPLLLQIIPYAVLHAEGQLLVYQREGGENRLHGLRSIGVGGHINPCDRKAYELSESTDDKEIAKIALRRELSEELGIDDEEATTLAGPAQYRGPIYTGHKKGAPLVQQVHLGLLFSIPLLDPALLELWKTQLTNPAWKTAEEIRSDKESLVEDWSTAVLNQLYPPTTVPE